MLLISCKIQIDGAGFPLYTRTVSSRIIFHEHYRRGSWCHREPSIKMKPENDENEKKKLNERTHNGCVGTATNELSRFSHHFPSVSKSSPKSKMERLRSHGSRIHCFLPWVALMRRLLWSSMGCFVELTVPFHLPRIDATDSWDVRVASFGFAFGKCVRVIMIVERLWPLTGVLVDTINNDLW